MTHARQVSAVVAEAEPTTYRYRPRKPEPEHRRTRQKLRRNSKIAGGLWEKKYRCPLGRGELRELARAARLFEERERRRMRWTHPGLENGPLGYVAVELMQFFCNVAAKHAGAPICWSVEALAERLGHAQSTVHAAKDRLKAAGLLDWVRRYVEVDGEGHARGPQVEQTSNLYVIKVPKWVKRILGAFGLKKPGPADAETAAAGVARDFKHWSFEESGLGLAFDRLGAAIASKREE